MQAPVKKEEMLHERARILKNWQNLNVQRWKEGNILGRGIAWVKIFSTWWAWRIMCAINWLEHRASEGEHREKGLERLMKAVLLRG